MIVPREILTDLIGETVSYKAESEGESGRGVIRAIFFRSNEDCELTFLVQTSDGTLQYSRAWALRVLPGLEHQDDDS